jgi:hypothetical protein
MGLALTDIVGDCKTTRTIMRSAELNPYSFKRVNFEGTSNSDVRFSWLPFLVNGTPYVI